MRVLITGARGFIGKNLKLRLRELGGFEVIEFTRGDSVKSLPELVKRVDSVVHLAGENRPSDPKAFVEVNADLTKSLCEAIRLSGKNIPLILASSTQAELDNPYGSSKRQAEKFAEQLARDSKNTVIAFRLPGVFGKWCRPNYNSVVATFCHNIANDLSIEIRDPSAKIHLAYVDDVVSRFIAALDERTDGWSWGQVEPVHSISLGELAEQIRAFTSCRDSLVVERVGEGLTRKLYATYVSYLPTQKFAYSLPSYGDERGVFVEMLKTRDSGQFSFFTAHPGVTRGGHYHHTKTEKFLIIKGRARFRFRNVLTDERHEIDVSGEAPQIVETIPGWAHDITNTGSEELVVMLWANEIFDRERPDTIASKVVDEKA